MIRPLLIPKPHNTTIEKLKPYLIEFTIIQGCI